MATGFPIIFGSSQARWTPAKISTALWLDAADATTVTLNGTAVSQWRDKSGNGRNASQSTATNQPTYQAGLSGKNAVVFDGSLDYLEITNNLFTGESTNTFTFIAVVVPDNSGRNSGVSGSTLLMRQLNSDGAGSWGVGYTADGRMYTRLHTVTGEDLTGSVFSNASTVVDDVGTMWNYDYNGPGGSVANDRWIFRQNGSTVARTSTQRSEKNWNNPQGNTYVGCGWLGGGAYQFKGEANEIIVTPNILDTTNRQLVEGYLAWKWGLQGSLPSNHPYKNTPP